MSRARNIKPGFFKNDLLAECSPLARILFCGLWCEADREGRLEDRVKRIKADCLPYDDCDVDDLLNQLAERGFIDRYTVEGCAYIQVVEFRKHQNPHVKEAASTIPAHNTQPDDSKQEPELPEAALDKPCASPVQDTAQTGTSPADSLLLIPDPPSPIPERGTTRPTKSRGSRLPPDWEPDANLLAWAKAERPDVLLAVELAKFRDYWIAKPGQQGVKLDWPATFRNWIRSAREGPPRAPVSKPAIAQNFRDKTYTGTPDDELPSFLRAAQA